GEKLTADIFLPPRNHESRSNAVRRIDADHVWSRISNAESPKLLKKQFLLLARLHKRLHSSVKLHAVLCKLVAKDFSRRESFRPVLLEGMLTLGHAKLLSCRRDCFIDARKFA